MNHQPDISAPVTKISHLISALDGCQDWASRATLRHLANDMQAAINELQAAIPERDPLPFDPETAARRTSLMPSSPQDLQLGRPWQP